jgi:flagellar biogenesis protein FliO
MTSWRMVAGALAVALVLLHPASAPAQEAAPRSGAQASAAIPFKQDSEITTDVSGRAVLALLVCLAVGAAAVYVLKQRLAPGAVSMRGRRVRLIESQRVGIKNALLLVRWDDEELLLGQSDGQMRLLARKPVSPGTERPREET